MSIRKKTLLIILLTTILLFIAGYFVSSKIILDGFINVENKETVEHLNRALDSINDKIISLSHTLGGWTAWDDPYQFMIDHNQKFLDGNFTYEDVIKPVNINMLLFVDNKAKLVASIVEDYNNGKKIPLPASLLPYISKGSRLITHPDEKDFVSGIITIDGKLLLIESKPMLNSNLQGPIHGTAVMARYVDPALEKELSAVTSENMSIYPYQSNTLPGDFVAARKYLTQTSSVYTHALSETQIAGYGVFPDISGKPGAIVRVVRPRIIYAQGIQSVREFTLLFGILTSILAIAMIILLQQTVLSRILKLYKTVLTIGKNKDITARVSLSGKDEIGTLAKAINTMFDALNKAIVGEEETKERFKNIADTAPIFIWLAGSDKKCTYINNSWLEFTGHSLTQELGDGWLDNIHVDDRDEFLKGYTAVFENHAVYKKEIRLRKTDGTYSWITTQIAPNITKEGNLVGCLGVGSDITDLKQSTSQIERINKLLEGREITLSELQKENERLKMEIKS